MIVLPFFTSTGMRDAERVGAVQARLCPQQKLLPFQIQSLTSGYLTTLALVDCDGAETDIFDDVFSSQNLITGWTNAGYNILNLSGTTILTAIESDSAESWCYSDEFALATGDVIKVDYNFTQNAVDIPALYLGKSDGTDYSAGTPVLTGANTVYMTATGNDSGNVRLLMQNETGDDCSFACSFSSVARNRLELDKFTTYDFVTYNGTILSSLLPYGVYYLKAGDGNTIWFSEWFTVKNLQPSLITAWGVDTYSTFITTGTTIDSAVGAGGGGNAHSGTFAVRTGERLIVTIDVQLNSGQLPHVLLSDSADATISDLITTARGVNEIELVATGSDAAAYLKIRNTAATSYWGNVVSIRRKAGNFVYLNFTNTKDFNKGDESILYQNGFTQQAYLDTYFNDPTHEPIEIGDEPNGTFIAEKLISRFIYNIVSYESRTMFNALRMLPMHDTIKIVDEVGNEYTPDPGNVRVSIDWTTFDTGTLRIDFNEDADVWTSNMDNIS